MMHCDEQETSDAREAFFKTLLAALYDQMPSISCKNLLSPAMQILDSPGLDDGKENARPYSSFKDRLVNKEKWRKATLS